MSEFSLLRAQSTETLHEMSGSVDVLLLRKDLLSPELQIKLDTLRADIAAALEDHEDSEQ
jgi:hypothetical protein